MAQTPDRMLIGETAWQKALAREAVIRPIAFVEKLTGPERFSACRQLGLRPTRFYQLLKQFRRKPVTSSLLDAPPGPKKGRRLLSPEQEAVVTHAIQETYCRREPLPDHITAVTSSGLSAL
ncbi:hypothetical protein [Rhizobium leguminosarum]|uniref:hypothetical protein n=1 Tax=Rhizobium leguminosarum TaxID=384 RepID=UPI0024A9F1D9|nr:hypothetical protein [Rhizobium leguminosarum]MDI5929405.1 hypothetical protein [Rhizobium leguminosarum]